MIDLCFFYSAKIAVVFFILMLSSATLEAYQRNGKDNFFDLMTAIGEHFGGEFNDAEKALKLDLNGANAFLERLHKFATHKIVRKNKNGEFECKESKKPDFKMAIKTILDEDMLNLLKVIPEKYSANEVYTLSTLLGEKLKPNEKLKDLLIVLPVKSLDKEASYTVKPALPSRSDQIPSESDQIPSESDQISSESDHIPSESDQIPSESDQIPSESDQIPSGSVDSVKFSEEKLFNLLFSFAARLEALVHGKNIDGTLKEKEENPKDKIQTFLAVPKCFIIPESKLNIFDYWIEIIEMKTDESPNPIFGVAIYKEKYDKWGDMKQEAFRLSRENYEILKQLNDQKFSIYESLNLLRDAFNTGYTPRNTPRGKMPEIFEDLLIQIYSAFFFNWEMNDNFDKNYKCEYAMFFQNISESLMKMISDKMIDPELHLDSEDKEIREKVQKDVEKRCKKFDNEEAKIILLNNVHYDLAINFEYNQQKDVHDRVEDLLSEWVGGDLPYLYSGLWQLSEESYLKKNASKMLNKIKQFTSEKTNRESISIIEALIEKEHFNQFNLVKLFDQIKTLVEETISEKEAKVKKAKKEINIKQLEKDFKFLKNNPKRIAEEKYQKVVAIICSIKQFGEKVKMLASKIKTIEIKEQLNELLSKIQKNEMKYFGPELLKQMKESCKQLKPKQIEMEENVSDEILLKDIQFEFDELNESFEGGWGRIEEYYLSIPFMQLTKRARNLAKTFEKMLQNVKENYA